MRPTSGGDALPSAKTPSRKSSISHSPAGHGAVPQNVPTTFFLRTEDDADDSPPGSTTPEAVNKQRQSTYGVESLADTLESAFGAGRRSISHDSQPSLSSPEPEEPNKNRQRGSSASEKGAEDTPSYSALGSRKHHRRYQSSNPPLPSNINTTSPAPHSAAPSTPKSVSLQSLRLSDEESGMEEAASQAIASSGEDEEDAPPEASTAFPQLVMPSIQMPSRRPFTIKGKAMGKLKVLVAGETGLGKTSLVRSIVQLCEDIVHVDSLPPPYPSQTDSSPRLKSQKRKGKSFGAPVVTEIHASTKAYPPWWSDSEDSRGLRRRKSTSDSVLERNICFVDTPGYGKDGSTVDEMNLTLEYIEGLLHRNASVGSMDDGDLLGVISGNGGLQVDVVIYMLRPTQDISKDIHYMQRLSALANVIPVIAKADTVSQSELMSIKTSILARLQTTSIKPFFFGKQVDDALLEVQGIIANTFPSRSPSDPDGSTPTTPSGNPFSTPTYPYAISSTPGPDTDTMDASLLMSSDYMQPLLPSELAHLVAQVFDPDSISWLRHSAAKKFLAWRRRTQLYSDSSAYGYQQPLHSPSPGSCVGLNGTALNASGTASIFSSASPSGVLVPRPNSPFYLTNSNLNSNLHSPLPGSSPSLTHTHAESLDGPSDFSLARYCNQMQREERFAEVRLAKWASDLQRSLRNERDRFEELQRSERAKWLLERMGEEVRGGSIVTSPTGSPSRADWAVVRHGNEKDTYEKGQQRYRSGGGYDSRDPLGLCELGDEFRRRSFMLAKVLGSMSFIGAVVVAVVKVSGLEKGFSDGGVLSWVLGNGSE